MTAKHYMAFRLVIAAVLAAIISLSVVIGNYVLPVVTFFSCLILMYAVKKKVKEVIEDERDYEMAGKAARYTMTVFSLIAGVITIILFALRKENPGFELVGSVLAYAVCGMMLIYSVIFKYFQSKGRENSFWIQFGLLIILLLFVVFGLRLFSGEDNWICQDGQWIKHGNPSAPMPISECK